MDKLCFDSPVGKLYIEADDKLLYGFRFEDDNNECPAGYPKRMTYEAMAKQAQKSKNAIIKQTVKELAEYFTGTRKQFTVPINNIHKGAPFYQKCWECVAKIPYGKTLTYKDVATYAGNPKACRAAGTAMAKNPVALIGPCHRVMGTNKNLTGFGGGVWRKKYLLTLEARFVK